MPLPIFPLIYAFARGVWSLFKDSATRGVVYLVGIVLVSGTFFYHRVEGWGWLDSLYFSVITLTTVGYGDFSPKTDAGKLFTIFYILVGLGILAGFISLIAQKQQEHNQSVRERRRSHQADQTQKANASSETPDDQP